MTAHHLALLVTGALLAVLCGLGLGLQLGWRRAAPRAAHHLLFFAVCAGTVLGGALALLAGERWWALLPALALLLSMPGTRPGRAGHWRLALAAAAAYALGGWAAW